MRKIVSMLLPVMMLLSLAAVSHAEGSGASKQLVVYYSYSQNTAAVARRVAALTGADLYEIRTVNAYPDDPYETSDISIQERREGRLPELVDDLPDLSGYETIFIGGPIWDGYLSTPLESYLEQTDLSDKTVIPFYTSMGSGPGGYLADFEARAQNPKQIGEILNIVFPGNGQPNAYSDAELDEKLKEWLSPYMERSTEKKLSLDSRIMLNSGYEMPVIGLGTWALTDEEAENCTYAAILDGCRLFDTARYYGTEAGIGRAVRRAISEGIITREDVFITTKIVPSGNIDYAQRINECNERIGLDYIDLMLIHQSGAGEKQLYRAMEDAVAAGTVKSIGISNYYTPEEFDDITEGASIMPAVVQNENHIYSQNTAFQQYVAQYGTVVESWYPFGGRGHTGDAFNNPAITAIAQNHGKSPAQIILRWHLQAGYVVIPGSSNPDHIAENLNVFDFELTDDEMAQIDALDTGIRYEIW